MAASPSALSSAQLLANFPPSTPEKEAQSRKTLGVCITTIAAGILLGGGLIAGGGLLFARVAPMPMHTHSILLYRLAYGLAATGIFALGGLCTVGGIFLHDYLADRQKIKQREQDLSQLTELTLRHSMCEGYLRRSPRVYFDRSACLDDVAKYFPHLKKLQIPEDAYTVDEQVVSHIPSTVEELELPVLNQKPEELLKILATTCQRLPLLRTCTLMISKDFMTEAVLQCLSSKAFENHAKMETLILRFPCGLSHPPIPKKTLENLLGQQFEISLVTTRPDLNYVIHQYTITKEKIDPLF